MIFNLEHRHIWTFIYSLTLNISYDSWAWYRNRRSNENKSKGWAFVTCLGVFDDLFFDIQLGYEARKKSFQRILRLVLNWKSCHGTKESLKRASRSRIKSTPAVDQFVSSLHWENFKLRVNRVMLHLAIWVCSVFTGLRITSKDFRLIRSYSATDPECR